MDTITINSVKELIEVKDRLLTTQQEIKIESVSNLIYTIKLKGGKYDNYDISYIDSNIAQIIMDYQCSYDYFIEGLEEEFGIQVPQSERLLKFKLEQGSLELDTEFFADVIMKGVEQMEGWQVMTVFIVAIAGWFSKEAYNKSIEKDIKKIDSNVALGTNETTREAIEALKTISLSQKLQTPPNSLKRNIAKILEDGEEAVINPEIDDSQTIEITNMDKNSYRNKKEHIEDIEDTIIIEDVIETQYFLKEGKPFKLQDLSVDANSSVLSVEKRMKLIQIAEKGEYVKMNIKLIKDGYTSKIKEAYIIDLLD